MEVLLPGFLLDGRERRAAPLSGRSVRGTKANIFICKWALKNLTYNARPPENAWASASLVGSECIHDVFKLPPPLPAQVAIQPFHHNDELIGFYRHSRVISSGSLQIPPAGIESKRFNSATPREPMQVLVITVIHLGKGPACLHRR